MSFFFVMERTYCEWFSKVTGGNLYVQKVISICATSCLLKRGQEKIEQYVNTLSSDVVLLFVTSPDAVFSKACFPLCCATYLVPGALKSSLSLLSETRSQAMDRKADLHLGPDVWSGSQNESTGKRGTNNNVWKTRFLDNAIWSINLLHLISQARTEMKGADLHSTCLQWQDSDASAVSDWLVKPPCPTTLALSPWCHVRNYWTHHHHPGSLPCRLPTFDFQSTSHPVPTDEEYLLLTADMRTGFFNVM